MRGAGIGTWILITGLMYIAFLYKNPIYAGFAPSFFAGALVILGVLMIAGSLNNNNHEHE